MKQTTKTLPEITITPQRKSAILQYLAITGHWQKLLYTNKGAPYLTLTDSDTELRRIEQTGAMCYDDGTLTLRTSLQCSAYGKPLFFQSAKIDTGFGTQKINAYDLRKYLTRQKSFEGTLFEGVA